MGEPRPAFPDVLGTFTFDPSWVLLLTAAALAYAWAFRRSRRGPGPHSAWRAAAYFGGLVAVGVATLSPLEHYGNHVLWVNFAGFLLLTMVGAPLIILGAPLTLAFRVSGPRGRARLRRLYRGRLATTLTFPVFSWLAFAVLTYAWQFTSWTDRAAENSAIRDLQLGSLLFVSLAFWTPAIASDPVRWRMAYPLRAFYVFVEMTHKGLFGGMFLSMNTAFHHGFASRLPSWTGLSPIDDQRTGILILWIGGNMIFLVALACLLIGWLAYERRNAHRTDWRLGLQREARRKRAAALEQVFTKGV